MSTRTGVVRPRLGVSSCLLGELVRFDGGHKRDPFLVDRLSAFVDWVPLCPEVALGLGAPRESLRLVASDRGPRLHSRSGRDLTEPMRALAEAATDDLGPLDGYVLKARSPTCGPGAVRVYDPNGMPSKGGRGVFARVLRERRGEIPCEDEGRMHDAGIREQFVERVFTRHRFRMLLEGDPRLGDLVAFHGRHKLLRLSHGETGVRRLGRIVAEARPRALPDVLADYGRELTTALAVPATRRRRTNALTHLAGHLSRWLDGGDREELTETIESYRLGRIALAVPIMLLAHHLRRFSGTWAAGQVYLDPYPAELTLRNEV